MTTTNINHHVVNRQITNSNDGKHEPSPSIQLLSLCGEQHTLQSVGKEETGRATDELTQGIEFYCIVGIV